MAECARHPGNPLTGCYWCRAALEPPVPDDLPREVLTVTRLAEMISGLDGYIERRAAGLARPVIEEAERSREVSDQRVTDLQAEFGRQVKVLERQRDRWREIAEGKASDLIVSWSEVRAGDRVLDGSLMTVREVYVYDDHLGISVTDEDGCQRCLDQQPDGLTAVRRNIGEVPRR